MNDLHNRRTFLRAAAVAGAAWVTADLGQVEEALAWAGHQTGKADAALTVLTRAQADVLDALTSRILPSLDGRPGAREAGAVYFIDRALATFNANQKQVYVDGIADLDRRAGLKSKASPTFAALTPAQQDEVIHDIEKTPFFRRRALRHDRRDLRAPDVGRQPRLRGLAHARVRAPAGVPAALRILRRRDQQERVSMDQQGQARPESVTRRFQPSDTVDFAIVGSGAAGGIIAKELATAGHSVVVLEQGPRLTEAQFTHDEFGILQNHNVNDPATQPQTFRVTPAETAQKGVALIYGRMVGGSNAHFTANFWRLRPSDFNEASRLGGVPGASLVDWPITYDELEPYYTKAEWELGVSGEPGPFDPPRSRPYPMPPLPVKSSGVLLERGARALGLHAQASPMAINSQPYNGRPACQHCGFCLFFMCEFRAKSTSMATMLPLAEATGRCEIRSDSYVARVETGPDGRATGVSLLRRRRSSCICSAPGPSCSARTEAKRRGCCSTPSRPASRTALPIRAASSAST